MALKSKEWFFKQCLAQIKGYGPLCSLCWDILEKGIGQKDSTRGHVTQAIGVAQAFLAEHPEHIASIRAADPTKPFDLSADPALAVDLVQFVDQSSGWVSKRFGFSYTRFKNVVTPTLGGTRTGGGGGNDEFKRVLRIMAEFI